MALTRRQPKSRVRIVGRDPSNYAQELQEKLEELDRQGQGIPAGFLGTTPETIQAGAAGDAGTSAEGWMSAGARPAIETGIPSQATGTAGAEGTGTALMRADAVIKQGIVTTKGDVLTHSATVPAREPVGANNTVFTADSAQTNGVKWATLASLLGYEPADLELAAWVF